MRRGPRQHNRTPGANMTPMIDVVFLLIIFFMLVAQITRQQSVRIQLPELEDRASGPIETENRVEINVLPLGGARAVYRMGSAEFDDTPVGLDRLMDALLSLRRERPGLSVVVRAGRTEPYGRVHPLMGAIRDSGVRRAELVIVAPGDGRDG